jgi:hypothetical protein
LSTPTGGLLFNTAIATTIALLLLFGGEAASARGGYQAMAQSSAPCGFVGGGLPDPAQTQRCLAERYKAPKSKPRSGSTPAAPPPSNAASSDAATSSAPPPPAQGS